MTLNSETDLKCVCQIKLCIKCDLWLNANKIYDCSSTEAPLAAPSSTGFVSSSDRKASKRRVRNISDNSDRYRIRNRPFPSRLAQAAGRPGEPWRPVSSLACCPEVTETVKSGN